MLEKLAVAILLAGQQNILANYWHLPPDTYNYLLSVGFSDSEFQAELQMFEIICADPNAHDPLWDPVDRPTERGEFLGETILDANGAFLNTGAPTHLDPSTGGFHTPDVTIVHESLQELCDYVFW